MGCKVGGGTTHTAEGMVRHSVDAPTPLCRGPADHEAPLVSTREM
jgi:hypothetical protein